MGSKSKTLSPQNISHRTALSVDQLHLIDLRIEIGTISKKMEALGVLEEKITNGTFPIKVEGTIATLLESHVDNWREILENPKTISVQDFESLKEKISVKKEEFENDFAEHKDEYNRKISEYREVQDQQLQLEVDALKTKLNTLSESDKYKIITEKSPEFTKQAWLTVELEMVRKKTNVV